MGPLDVRPAGAYLAVNGMVPFVVELCGFGATGSVRFVDVPAADVEAVGTAMNTAGQPALLDLIYRYGTIATPEARAIAAGDVVRLNGRRYRVESDGFVLERGGGYA